MNSAQAMEVVRRAEQEFGWSRERIAAELHCCVDTIRKWDAAGSESKVSRAIAVNVSVLDGLLSLAQKGGRDA